MANQDQSIITLSTPCSLQGIDVQISWSRESFVFIMVNGFSLRELHRILLGR